MGTCQDRPIFGSFNTGPEALQALVDAKARLATVGELLNRIVYIQQRLGTVRSDAEERVRDALRAVEACAAADPEQLGFRPSEAELERHETAHDVISTIEREAAAIVERADLS